MADPILVILTPAEGQRWTAHIPGKAWTMAASGTPFGDVARALLKRAPDWIVPLSVIGFQYSYYPVGFITYGPVGAFSTWTPEAEYNRDEKKMPKAITFNWGSFSHNR